MTRPTINSQIALAIGALMISLMLALPFGSEAATTQPPPKRPYAVTGSFLGLTTTSVTLGGRVNPHGNETVYAFQYGPTTGYGAQTALTPVGNGTTEAKVSQTIAGLQPNTTYHYRIVATNGVGTTNGLDASFATKKIPLKFQVTATPDPVVYGNSFSVEGLVTGSEAANRELNLQADPFPYLGIFREVSNPTMTGTSGSFSFPVANLLENTQLRVGVVGMQGVNSRTMVERVAARVSLHLRSTRRRGMVRIYGAVEPSEVGASVSFQLLRPGRAPLNVAWTKTDGTSPRVSRFTGLVRIHHRGFYRALVLLDNGMQMSGHSRILLLR